MSAVEFIGDEISAAGYRLCGVNVTPTETTMSPDRLLSLIRQARERTSLLLLGSETASRLQQTELETLLAATESAVIIVPDIRCRVPAPDLTARLHTQLGMLE